MSVEKGGSWVVRARWIKSSFNVEVKKRDAGNANGTERLDGEIITRPGVVVNELDIPDQGITVVVGASASGKSTLLGILTGLSKADAFRKDRKVSGAGESTILFRSHGRKSRNLLRGSRPIPGDIGFVFQDAHLLKSLSAKRNAALGAMISADAPTKDVFSVWHKEFQVAKEGSSPIEKLSGGEQQRVTVMRALGMDPALLVCDEPTSNLDKKTADLVMRKIADWSAKPGRAVLWVTHDLKLAARYANRFVGVKDGVVLSNGALPFVQQPAFVDKVAECTNYARMRRVLISGDKCPEMGGIPAPSIAAEAEKRQRVGWFRRRIARVRALGFAWTSSLADAFSDGLRAKSNGSNSVLSGLRGVFGLGLRSLTWVLLLGLTVFYGVAMANDAFDTYFKAKLNAPESSHLVITAERVSLLAPHKLPKLGKALSENTPLKYQKIYRKPKFYGRRTDQLVEIWSSDDGNCVKQSSGGIGPALLVYDRREPLYGELDFNVTGTTTLTKIKKLDPREFRNGAIVTPNFFRFLGVSGKGISQLKGFCANLSFGPAYLKIIGVAKSLPGGADDKYDIAIEERMTYRRIFYEKKPETFRDERGRLTLPAYVEAAGYFDYRDRDRVFCSFLGCRDGEDAVEACRVSADKHVRSVKSRFAGYQINCDSLAQVSRLIDAASGARLMFGALALAFLAAIGLSTGLAAQALVSRNEKAIALMRAFGYGLPHVFILLFGKIVVKFIAAMGSFSLLLIAFDKYFAPQLAAAIGTPLSSITARLEMFAIAAVGSAGIVVVVALIVLIVWWFRHRWIGPVLQSL